MHRCKQPVPSIVLNKTSLLFLLFVRSYETRLFASLLQLYRAMARLGRKNFPDVVRGTERRG